MFGAVFSFGGRLNRLQYFLGCVGLGMAGVVALVVLFVAVLGSYGAAKAGGGAGALAALGPALLLALPLLAAWFWISLSLQVRRFRDIGWNPVFVVPAWIGFSVIDSLVASASPSLGVGPLHHNTIVGVLINLALGCVLLFWPGRSWDDYAPVLVADERAPPPPASRAAPPPAAATRAAAPAATAPPSFGRRGT